LPRRRKSLKTVEEIVERWRSGWLYHYLYRKAELLELPEVEEEKLEG